MSELKTIIEESFTQYAGAVLQSRALVDVRDGLKPSARQLLYCMDMCKYTYNKPYEASAAVVGDCLKHFYVHGDTSCLAVIMRMAQPFAMRYPLAQVSGNGGTLMDSGTWAAARYTKTRLSKLAGTLFTDIKKDTIDEWRDNFSDTVQYPSVLPTKGFYNICNGTQGIGIGMASSIPQYNLKEVNQALITLLQNPDCSFEDIYCAPDFATGAILYNEAEVKESMKTGNGKACKLRSVVDFDAKERCFVITEIPYGVYTNTICGQLEEIINGDNNPGIERFNDLTGQDPLIKIYLNKKANPDRVLKYLYKNTSLQYHYGINFTMLDMGRFPKVFTWKEMLQAHLDHEKIVYRRGFLFDLNKIEKRLHIVDGLLICMANIDEVVTLIKNSKSTAAASIALQNKFLLDEEQAKAVLDMKLSRLAHLEVEKLENEKTDLLNQYNSIKAILESEELFNKEIINGLQEVSQAFGDERRTKIIAISEGDNDEVIEEKQLSISFTNNAAVYVSESSSLYTQKRNGVGSKFKLEKDEYVVDNVIGKNTDTILFFTSHGNFYHMKMGNFSIGEKQYLNNFVTMLPYEKIVAAAPLTKDNQKNYIVFLTKNGIIKKTELSEYNMKRNTGATAIKLDKDDMIVSVLFTNEGRIGILSQNGNFIMINSKEVRPIGRVARGVVGMKLNEGDVVASAHLIPTDTKEIMSITTDGYSKRTDISEFKITGRGTKGVKIQKSDSLCDFLPITNNNDILVISSTAQLRVRKNDISLLSRGAIGTKTIKLSDNSIISKISSF